MYYHVYVSYTTHTGSTMLDFLQLFLVYNFKFLDYKLVSFTPSKFNK